MGTVPAADHRRSAAGTAGTARHRLSYLRRAAQTHRAVPLALAALAGSAPPPVVQRHGRHRSAPRWCWPSSAASLVPITRLVMLQLVRPARSRWGLLGDNRLARMNESSRRVRWPAARVTRKHSGDIRSTSPKKEARHANALLRVFVFRYRLKALPSSLRRWAGPPFFHHRGGPSSIRGSRSLPWRVNQHPLGYPSRPSHFVGFL